MIHLEVSQRVKCWQQKGGGIRCLSNVQVLLAALMLGALGLFTPILAINVSAAPNAQTTYDLALNCNDGSSVLSTANEPSALATPDPNCVINAASAVTNQVAAAVQIPTVPTVPIEPTDEPTDVPTDEPTDMPTDEPTDVPTDEPTETATATPTNVAPVAISISDPYECGGSISGNVAGGQPPYTVTVSLNGPQQYTFSVPVEADGSWTLPINYTDENDPNYVVSGDYVNSYSVTDSANQTDSDSYQLTIEECPPPLSKLSGYLWHDLDRNSVKNGSEPAFNDVEVILYSVDELEVTGLNGREVARTRTDANGYFEFLVVPDEYELAFEAPQGFNPADGGVIDQNQIIRYVVNVREGDNTPELGDLRAQPAAIAVMDEPTSLDTIAEPDMLIPELYLPFITE